MVNLAKVYIWGVKEYDIPNEMVTGIDNTLLYRDY